MKHSLLACAVASGLLLAGCSQPTETAQTDTAKPATEQAAPDAQKGRPELGSFGVDLTARNEAVKPGDDFFMYASGTWYDNYVMPADKTRYGAFTGLAERSEERVKAIIDDLSKAENLSGEAKLIADFYNAYMDTDALEEKGFAPIQDMLDGFAAIETTKGLTKAFGNAWLTGTQSPIWGGMWYNRLDPNEYQLSVGVGGLGLPDRDYYLSDETRFVDLRNAYQAHIAKMLDMAGVEGAEEKAQRILALETRIAEVQWPREKRRNRDLTLNQIERDQLNEAYPGFDWDAFFASSGFKVPALNVTQPEPVNDVIALINEQPLDDWKAYLQFHAIAGNADLLAESIYLADFEFFGKVLSGQQEPKARWKRAVAQMSGTESLGFAIGKVYVERYFPESSKQQMSELVENLRTALGERIENLDWMSEDTKKNAQEKLASFRPKIGYPDEWESFDGLTISADDLMANVHNIRRFFQAKDVARELEPTDRERWGMTPQRVNAYYNSSFNEIVFPAAILQPPFFDPNADPAVNYGGIGAVIGHEMGHGFDDQGSKSDANGIQRNWWTDADRAAFEAKADKLAAQYSAYEPIEGQFVNGRNSLGENIGDVGGLAMAYHAYKLSLNGKEAPVIDGLTGDQRFFLAWAQVWKEKRTEQSMLNQLKGGTHAPGRYRALAPRNHDAWYEAFNVQPGDALYLAPEERVRIW
ncbi:M13 family metallopeptidase [Aestuariibacter halophilus]|uniref:M13 family metallopeptidase n=1 Tax=Fluctibacter halophilus TaxID=226011 RepID=A0ABS8GCC9_9ALTE|nr:M13 family metallopeptidase [Aestuariibacter halophilus]MCC2617475.1 M13 family metallopeptidase [Aestuariibacter halophilus]